MLAEIAVKQWKRDVSGWLEHYKIDESPENLCLEMEIESQDWETEICEAYMGAEEESRLRRTIAAVAKLVPKLKGSNDDMRRVIARAQGDIE